MSKENPKVGLILAGLMLGMLLAALDQTVVSTAMPTVIKDLGGMALYSWVFSVYMLTSTTSIPIFGKLADLYGRKRLYVLGMLLFMVGSALCGLAGNMTELIVFRGIQGIGAGALMPLAITIIGDVVPLEQRGKMQGLFGAVFGLSSVIGPAVGGFIADHWNWHWVFYVNLPFGIAALFLIAIALQESRRSGKQRIDWFGSITLSGSIIALLLALVLGGNVGTPGTHYAWGSAQIIGLFGAGAVLLGLFLWIETKVQEPILPLKLFRNRVFAVSSVTGFLMSVGMFGAITYIPLFVQGVIGVRASTAGYILTPLMLTMIASSIVAGRLMMRVSYRTLMMVGMGIMAVGFVLMAQMNVHTSNGTVAFDMIVTGLGMGPTMPAMMTAVQGEVPMYQRAVATSSVKFFQSIGATIGVSVLGVLMTNRMTTGLTGIDQQFSTIPANQLHQLTNPQILLNPQARLSMPQGLLQNLLQVFANSVQAVFLAGLVFIIVGLVVAWFMGNASLKCQTGTPASSQPHLANATDSHDVEEIVRA